MPPGTPAKGDLLKRVLWSAAVAIFTAPPRAAAWDPRRQGAAEGNNAEEADPWASKGTRTGPGGGTPRSPVIEWQYAAASPRTGP
eukprot:3048278-Alexandrium_andersonii.AAC.1